MTFTSQCSLGSNKIRTTQKTLISLPIVLAVLSMFVWGGGYVSKIDMAELMERAQKGYKSANDEFDEIGGT